MATNYFRNLVEKSLNMAMLPYTPSMVNQILGTSAVESDFFMHNKQLGSGPALGFFQCEPRTRQDILDNYLKYKPRLRKRIENAFGDLNVTDEFFAMNIPLQVVFCYLHYERYNAWGRSLDEYATYWKKYYNTYGGKGSFEDYVKKYRMYVED